MADGTEAQVDGSPAALVDLSTMGAQIVSSAPLKPQQRVRMVLTDPLAASRMGYALAKRFFTDHVATVASASIWGAGLAQWVAYFLDPKARVIYATRRDDRLTIVGAEPAPRSIR